MQYIPHCTQHTYHTAPHITLVRCTQTLAHTHTNTSTHTHTCIHPYSSVESDLTFSFHPSFLLSPSPPLLPPSPPLLSFPSSPSPPLPHHYLGHYLTTMPGWRRVHQTCSPLDRVTSFTSSMAAGRCGGRQQWSITKALTPKWARCQAKERKGYTYYREMVQAL